MKTSDHWNPVFRLRCHYNNHQYRHKYWNRLHRAWHSLSLYLHMEYLDNWLLHLVSNHLVLHSTSNRDICQLRLEQHLLIENQNYHPHSYTTLEKDHDLHYPNHKIPNSLKTLDVLPNYCSQTAHLVQRLKYVLPTSQWMTLVILQHEPQA